jgi:hypothetical protein
MHQFSKSWVGVLLLAATSAFAQAQNEGPGYDQGHEVWKCQMPSGYNAPACIKLNDSAWDVYASGSFIYWQAREENLEIGLISQNDPEGRISTADTPFTTGYVNNMTVTQPHFTYRPGFKLGVGMTFDWDGWDAYAEYTRFHQTIATSVAPLSRDTATVLPPNGQYLYPIQGAPGGLTNMYFQNANQAWTLKMDFFDVSLGRGYYSGTKLTVRPSFGARAAWIRQNLTTTSNGSTNYLTATGYHNYQESDYFASWGIGPRAGFESNWLVGHGLRFIGNGSADILYTRYHTHSTQQVYNNNVVAGGTNPITTNASVSQEIDYLRTHLDLEMGFGWGTYFDDNNWHVDLSAVYGFQVFWDQNMFREFSNSTMQAKSFAPNGNLYVHGLTLSARFDF